MDQYIYSGRVNTLGGTEVTLWTVWRDNLLIGLAPVGGNMTKSWVKPGEIIQMPDGTRWVLLEMVRAQEPDAPKMMAHLLPVA